MIEGFSQKAKWLIDARFNRAELADRIRQVGHYRNRIHLSNDDAEVFLRRLKLPSKSLVYLDPPYFQKGQRMYRNHYVKKDHGWIANLVQKKLPYSWIVSYDDAPEIAALYAARRKIRYTRA